MSEAIGTRVIRRLLFRCRQCRTVTGVQAEWVGKDPVVVSCSNCHEAFTLRSDRDRGLSDLDFRERMGRFASENKLDLASAYAVFEEILPRDRVRTFPTASTEPPQSSFPVGRALLTLVVVLLVAGVVIGRSFRNAEEPPAAPASMSRAVKHPVEPPRKFELPPSAPVVYKVDSDYRVIQVIAPDPPTALFAYCTEERNAKVMTAYAVAPAVPPADNARIGIVRDREQLDRLSSVSIWFNPANGRWTVGDGRAPIELEPIQAVPKDATLF